MAARFTAVELLDVFDSFKLSESDSEGESNSRVTAYHDTSLVDVEKVQAPGEAVSTQALGVPGMKLALALWLPAFFDSSDEVEVEEDFLGKNRL